jgi:hypothetical protein
MPRLIAALLLRNAGWQAELRAEMKRLKRACSLVALVLCLTLPAAAGDSGDPINVEAAPSVFARFLGQRENFGKLAYRGGLVLTSTDDRFGGLSGLAFSSDGRSLIAVSDDGWWVQADVLYESGRPSALVNTRIAPIVDRNGRRSASKARHDAEAIALDPPGRLGAFVYVGFESLTRIEKFDMRTRGLAARPSPVTSPRAMTKGPKNGQLEALGSLDRGPLKGSLIAISEDNLDADGNIRAWLIRGSKSRGFAIARYEDYEITDLAVLPDGAIITLERSFSSSSLPGMAIRKFNLPDLPEGALVSPELLFSGRQPFYRIDNMEGIAVHHWGDELRISVISDDNYNHGIQKTVLYQFALPP